MFSRDQDNGQGKGQGRPGNHISNAESEALYDDKFVDETHRVPVKLQEAVNAAVKEIARRNNHSRSSIEATEGQLTYLGGNYMLLINARAARLLPGFEGMTTQIADFVEDHEMVSSHVVKDYDSVCDDSLTKIMECFNEAVLRKRAPDLIIDYKKILKEARKYGLVEEGPSR